MASMQKSLVTPGAGGGQDERDATGDCAVSARGVASGAGAMGADALVVGVGVTRSERTCAAGPALRLL
jgi:hypothetical protein